MASLASVARDRKAVLKNVMASSLKLDARQEALEREIKRLLTRKRAIPETEDMIRLIGLADSTAEALTSLVSVVKAAADSFRMQ